MNAERALKKLRGLSQELREQHATNLCTNINLTERQFSYSQGYINALDWMEQTVAADLKEETDEDEL